MLTLAGRGASRNRVVRFFVNGHQWDVYLFYGLAGPRKGLYWCNVRFNERGAIFGACHPTARQALRESFVPLREQIAMYPAKEVQA